MTDTEGMPIVVGMAKKKRKIGTQTSFVFESTAKVLPLAVKGERLVITGHEEFASKFRDRAERIAILQEEDKKERQKLAKMAKPVRLRAELEGNFQKSVLLVCETGKPVRIEFGDSYKDIDVKYEETLQGALGDLYGEFFSRPVAVKARDGVTLGRLREVLGDRFDAFMGLVDLKEYLAPIDGFMEARAGLRPKLSAEANQVLDNLIDQIQNAPSVKIK